MLSPLALAVTGFSEGGRSLLRPTWQLVTLVPPKNAILLLSPEAVTPVTSDSLSGVSCDSKYPGG